MRIASGFGRASAIILTALLVTGVTAVTYVAPAQAADGFSVDDFNGNSMGTREVVPANPSNCDVTDSTSLTMGTGTMRVNVNVPDSRGCNYASAQVRWTAGTSVNIEQNGADRIILKYRDVTPNQPSAVTFGLHLVDVNGRTANVGGLTRNGGAAGDWLTIRYTPEYVGDVSVLNFQSGFDRGHVKSVALLIAATTNNQNVGVTFEGIGTNVGEPSYEAPSFGNAAAYDFPASTATTKTFVVTGNPAPDVTWTGKPSWMTITTSAVSGGRQVTMSGDPGIAYSDSNIAFHADVANSLTADASVRIVVPSPVTVTPNSTTTQVGVAGPVVLGTATSVPAPTFVNNVSGLPAGTSLALSGTNIVLNGTPTVAGTYSIAATVGNDFRTAPFSRSLIVGQPPAVGAVATQTYLRGTAISPLTVTSTGYPAPSLAITNLPAGLTAAGGVISGTPTATSTTTVTVTATNSFGADTKTFTIKVGDAPTVTAPSSLDLVAGTALDATLPVTGVPTTFTATGLPDGTSAQFAGGVAKLVGTPTRPANSAAASGTATVTVTNDFGTQSKQIPWTVSAVPELTGPTFAAATVGTALSPVDITITGYPSPTVTVTDPDDDGTLVPPGITVDQSVPGVVSISGTPTAAGTEHVRITATNGVGGTIIHDITISARSLPAFVDATPTLTLLQGTTSTRTLDWSGYPTATLALQSALPSWLEFDPATGVFTATPPADIDGSYGPFRVDATNAAGTASAQVTVNVTSPSQLSALSDVVVAQGAGASATVGSVSGYPAPTVTASGLPAGVSLVQSGSLLVLQGAPTSVGGVYQVIVTAANGVGADDTGAFTFTVTTPATLVAPGHVTIPLGQPATIQTTPGGFPLPTVIGNGLPAGMTLDPSGVISGTPLATGDYMVNLSTSGGSTAGPGWVLMILTVSDAPAFSPAPTDSALRLGEFVDESVFGVTGYPEPTVSASGLPAGLNIVTTDGNVTLSGTPTQTGVFPVSVTISSSAGSLQHTWYLTIEDPAAVSVAATATAHVGDLITAIPVTTGGYPSPTVTAAGLPDGLTLESDIAGTRIVGTPTEDGHYSVLLTATNGVGTSATATILIDVQSTPTLGGDVAAIFPAGETTTLTLPVTGYPAPALTTTTLPSWLAFDAATGIFTATPTVGDDGPGGVVTVTATSAGGTASVDVTLEVTSPPAVAASGGTTTILAGDTVSEDLTTVTGYPVPTATASGLPDGLAVSLVGDVLTLTGSATDSGSHDVTITLSNGSGPDLDVPWTIVVNEPSALTLPSDTTAVLGHPVDFAIGVTGYPSPTVSVTGLPAGLSWVPGAGGGHIVGSPTAAGTSTIQVTATNGIGTDAAASFTLTVDLPTISVTPSAGSVEAGDSIGVTAEGFQPGEQVTVVLHSTPVLLTTVTADAQGRVNTKVTIPSGTAVGSHTLVVTGATGATGSAPITVLAAGTLSGTGFDAVTEAGIALALLIMGGALVMVRRFGSR